MLSYENIFPGKKSVLFVTAHPDDADLFFGGLIIRLTRDKIPCYFQILTSGASGKNFEGSKSLPETREDEQVTSLSSLGIPKENIHFARLEDGHLENNLDLIGQSVWAIRKWQPEVVCTIDPQKVLLNAPEPKKYISHRDHRAVGTATIDAVYPYAETEQYFSEFGPAHKVFHVILAENNDPNLTIDFTADFEAKKKLLATHQTQWTPAHVESILKTFSNPGSQKYEENLFYFEVGSRTGREVKIQS